MKSQSFVTFILCALILAFQNCSPLNTTSEKAKDEFFKSGNNGGMYGGKPSGLYYRFAQDYTCEAKESAKAKLDISNASVTLTQNSAEQCAKTQEQINFSDLDLSEYQNYLVGYKESIFESQNEEPNKIPANLVEVWCKESSTENRFEIIAHYDRDLQKAVTRLYYTEAQSNGVSIQRFIKDFDVSRVITSQTVELRGPNNFSLTVNRDQPDSQYGLMKSSFTIQLLEKNIQQNLACRVGGSLDVSVWPAKQLTDFGYYPRNLGLSPDGKHFAFVAGQTGKYPDFFIGKIDGSIPQKINVSSTTPLVHGGGLVAAAFAADSSQISFLGTNPATSKSDLFSFHFESSEIESRKISISSDLVKTFAYSEDGQYLIYEDQLSIPYAYASRLKSYNFRTNTELIISPPAATQYVRGITKGFYFSKTANRAVFIWDAGDYSANLPLRVFSVRPDGTDLRELTVGLPVTPFTSVWLPNAGDIALVMTPQSLQYSASSVKTWSVAVDGATRFEVPSQWTWSFANSTGEKAFLVPISSQALVTQSKLMNYKTGQMMDLPAFETFGIENDLGLGYGNFSMNLPITTIAQQVLDNREASHPSLFFTANSSYLIGRVRSQQTSSENTIYQALAVKTDNGQQVHLCPSLVGKDMWLAELNSETTLIVTYNLASEILEVYSAGLNGECQKLNSLLSTNATTESLREVTLSADKSKILTRITKKWGRQEVSTKIFYVPLNGSPAYQINLPLTERAHASTAYFTADSKSVIFLGNLHTSDEQSLYLWKVPGPVYIKSAR